MYARSAIIAVLALPLLASAATSRRGGNAGTCNSGPVQCCDETQGVSLYHSFVAKERLNKFRFSRSLLATLLVPSVSCKLLPVFPLEVIFLVSSSKVMSNLFSLVNCTPIDVLAVDGHDCTSQVACCSHNSFVSLSLHPLSYSNPILRMELSYSLATPSMPMFNLPMWSLFYSHTLRAIVS